MQNHAPYDNYYQTTTHFAQHGDLNNDQYQKLETYLTGLSHTDQALDNFYQKLQALPQKTLVVIYGDHFPGSDGLGKVTDADAQLARRTPIVMLANFPLPERDFGTISGNYLTLEIPNCSIGSNPVLMKCVNNFKPLSQKCHFITAIMMVIFPNIQSTAITS